jgi:hypothetical protein
MNGHWSFCPAEAFVPALLGAAWNAANGVGGEPR